MTEPNLMPYQNEPFNGDTFVCEEFLKLKEQYNIDVAIETGSCLFSTTKWLGENFKKVYTIEINEEFAKYGRGKVSSMPNVVSEIGTSDLWLNELKNRISEEQICIFFLDAHWGNDCPLLRELEAIAHFNTKHPPIIVIHDFYTGDSELGYDEYNGQPFTWDWIKPSIQKIEELSEAKNFKYEYYYNKESIGAKRGVIYIKPINPSL
jgi:hypothetical protein